MPSISIITATHKRPEKLLKALESVVNQDCPNWEYLISPDDGVDYTHLASIDPRIRVLPPGPIATGPGPTRNRALKVATGQVVAVLDDDDHVPPNYVSSILDAVEKHGSCALPVTYLDPNGKIIRSVGQDLTSMDISEFSKLLCTMHFAGSRGTYPMWPDCFAEDVVHTCMGIGLSGGRIQLCQNTTYFINTSADSMCASRESIEDDYKKAILMRPWGKDSKFSKEIEDLFSYRIDVDKKYSISSTNLSYHAYVKAGLHT
jgi:glycosyltransferase involved in cell wall biosynthesis